MNALFLVRFFEHDALVLCFTRADAYRILFKHKHKVDNHWYVCNECLDMDKRMTLQLCEIMQRYFSKIAVVFSGCAGFHVHVMDFDARLS